MPPKRLPLGKEIMEFIFVQGQLKGHLPGKYKNADDSNTGYPICMKVFVIFKYN
jgi:hypothetical protein